MNKMGLKQYFRTKTSFVFISFLGFAYGHGTNRAPFCQDCFINVIFEVKLAVVVVFVNVIVAVVVVVVIVVVVLEVDLFTEVMGKLGFGLLLFLLPAVLTTEPCRDQDGERQLQSRSD